MRLSLLESDLKSRIDDEMRSMAARREAEAVAASGPVRAIAPTLTEAGSVPVRPVAPTLVDIGETMDMIDSSMLPPASAAPSSFPPAAPSMPPAAFSMASVPPPPLSYRPASIPPAMPSERWSSAPAHWSVAPPDPSMVDAAGASPFRGARTTLLAALAILVLSTSALAYAAFGKASLAQAHAHTAPAEVGGPAGAKQQVETAEDDAVVAPAPTLAPAPPRWLKAKAEVKAETKVDAPAPAATPEAAAAAPAPEAPAAAIVNVPPPPPDTREAKASPAGRELDQAARTAQMLKDQLSSSVH